jgi:hypothetical protein
MRVSSKSLVYILFGVISVLISAPCFPYEIAKCWKNPTTRNSQPPDVTKQCYVNKSRASGECWAQHPTAPCTGEYAAWQVVANGTSGGSNVCNDGTGCPVPQGWAGCISQSSAFCSPSIRGGKWCGIMDGNCVGYYPRWFYETAMAQNH